MEFNAEEFKENLTARLKRQYGKDITQANAHDLFDAVSASAQELIMDNWMKTRREYEKKPTRQEYGFPKVGNLMSRDNIQEEPVI